MTIQTEETKQGPGVEGRSRQPTAQFASLGWESELETFFVLSSYIISLHCTLQILEHRILRPSFPNIGKVGDAL